MSTRREARKEFIPRSVSHGTAFCIQPQDAFIPYSRFTMTAFRSHRWSSRFHSDASAMLGMCLAGVLMGGVVALPVFAQESAPPAQTEYVLGFSDANKHFIDVQLRCKSPRPDSCELMMATWTPGSYLIREYARNVDQIHAEDAQGQPLRLQKTTKNRWVIQGKKLKEITVNYRVYCREMSVRTNFVDRDFAVLNGCLLYTSDAADE